MIQEDKQNKFLYKKPQKIKTFRHITSLVPNAIWAIDLADYTGKEQGNNRGYILVCIDIFSRYLYTRVMNKKTANDIWINLESIFQEAGTNPKFFYSDREAGLLSNEIDEKLTSKGIQVYHVDGAYSRGGSPIAERVIRTIREKLEQLRDVTTFRNWKQHVEDVTKEYNGSVHRTIKMTPDEARQDTDKTLQVQKKIKDESNKEIKPTLNENQTVLLKKDKETFEKGFTQTFKKVQFKIVKVHPGNPPLYELDTGDKYYKEQLLKLTQKDIDYLNSRAKRK